MILPKLLNSMRPWPCSGITERGNVGHGPVERGTAVRMKLASIFYGGMKMLL